jgi:uncharacterized protein YxeA
MNETVKAILAALTVIMIWIAAVCLIYITAANLSGKDILVKEKFVSERIEACEEKGGRYSLRYSDYYKNYDEDCDISSREIENF